MTSPKAANAAHPSRKLAAVVICANIFAHSNWASTPIEIPKESSLRPVLTSIYAGVHQISDFYDEDTEAVVFIFTSDRCPVAQQYIPRLNELYGQYRSRGVQFVAIYSNSGVDVMSMAKHAHDADIHYPVFLDGEHRLADLLDVQTTPEIVVLAADLVKRYQGPVDDQFTKRGRKGKATQDYLGDAIAAVVDDRLVAPAFVPTSGCPLERRSRPPLSNEVTYYRDIAPILQDRCQSCHREGNVAPMELMTYEDAYYSATTIAEVVKERRMPPFHAFLEPQFGRLRHDPRLTAQEIRMVLDWVDAGAPEGDPADAPAARTWPNADAWTIGQPDFVYKMPVPFDVPKTGVLDYQFFRVKLDLPEERWIQAIEVRPGNTEVVHHIAVNTVRADNKSYSGIAGMVELYGYGNDHSRLIGDYVPGDPFNAKTFPTGQAMRIPKGSDLLYELHYTPNNRDATTDQSEVAIRWAEQAPSEEVHSRVYRKSCGRFLIPPHEHHYRMEDSYYFEEDVEIDAIRAHFHRRGKSYRLEIIRHNELTGEIVQRETVLTIPVWDLDWQRTYELETPLFVEAGAELRATGHFDNSRWNPNNPDPEQSVLWGQQTDDEMFNTRFIARRVQRPIEMATRPALLDSPAPSIRR